MDGLYLCSPQVEKHYSHSYFPTNWPITSSSWSDREQPILSAGGAALNRDVSRRGKSNVSLEWGGFPQNAVLPVVQSLGRCQPWHSWGSSCVSPWRLPTWDLPTCKQPLTNYLRVSKSVCTFWKEKYLPIASICKWLWEALPREQISAAGEAELTAAVHLLCFSTGVARFFFILKPNDEVSMGKLMVQPRPQSQTHSPGHTQPLRAALCDLSTEPNKARGIHLPAQPWSALKAPSVRPQQLPWTQQSLPC